MPDPRQERFDELVALYLADPTDAAVIAELETMDDLVTPEVRRKLTGGMLGN